MGGKIPSFPPPFPPSLLPLFHSSNLPSYGFFNSPPSRRKFPPWRNRNAFPSDIQHTPEPLSIAPAEYGIFKKTERTPQPIIPKAP